MLSKKQDYVSLRLSTQHFETEGEDDGDVLDQLLCQARDLGPNESTRARFSFLSQDHRVNGTLRVCPFEELSTGQADKAVSLARQSDLVTIERGPYRRKYEIDPFHNAPLSDSVLEVDGMSAGEICDQLNSFARQLGEIEVGKDHPTYVFVTDAGNAILTLEPEITWGLTSRHHMSIETAARVSEFVTIHREAGYLKFRIAPPETSPVTVGGHEDVWPTYESGGASRDFLGEWDF